MNQFHFEVEREPKRRRNSGGKALRIIVLFCLVAIITAAVIYAIVPRSKPEKSAGNETAKEEVSGNTAEKTDPETSPKEDDKSVFLQNTGNKADAQDTGAGKTPDNTAGNTEDNSKESPAGQKGSIADKFSPSESELQKITAKLHKSLADGSWIRGKEIITHRVASGDSLEKIARKYRSTVQFLKQYNRISNVNTIRIGQKIRCFQADRWEITISRKGGFLQVDRIIGDNRIPFAIFHCQSNSNTTADDLVVCRRFAEPFLIDAQGRRFAPDTPENPFGKGQITLARASAPDSRLRFSIHGKSGSNEAMAKSLAAGSIALDNQDMKLLYTLIPEKSPVKIVD